MRVIAMEPMAENVRYFERHIWLNGIQNIEVLVAVIGLECGRESFLCGDNRSTGHLAPGQYGDRCGHAGFNVCEIRRSRCVKMDVEGAEYLALQDAERCLAGPDHFSSYPFCRSCGQVF